MTADELRALQIRIKKELNIRKYRLPVMIERNSDDGFIITAQNINQKGEEIKDIFENYGPGSIVYLQNENDKISFVFDCYHDVDYCRHNLEKVINQIKKTLLT